MPLSDPGILIAVITGLVALAGYGLARRGTREQNQQSAAATALAALEARADRAEKREEYERERAEKAEARYRAAEDKIDEVQATCRKELSDQSARCTAVHDSLTTTIVTLRDVVLAEVAKAAAQTALDEVSPHPHAPDLSAGD